jgi:hypothetical protein
VRSESNRGLLCSVASKAVEAMIATSRRVLIDGPVANKSFIADASYQLKKCCNQPLDNSQKKTAKGSQIKFIYNL